MLFIKASCLPLSHIPSEIFLPSLFSPPLLSSLSLSRTHKRTRACAHTPSFSHVLLFSGVTLSFLKKNLYGGCEFYADVYFHFCTFIIMIILYKGQSDLVGIKARRNFCPQRTPRRRYRHLLECMRTDVCCVLHLDVWRWRGLQRCIFRRRVYQLDERAAKLYGQEWEGGKVH